MVVCGLAVVNLLYAREVVIRAKVPPGWGRLLLFMPCLISHVYFPSKTLDPFEEVLASAVSFTNFGWWTNFKLMVQLWMVDQLQAHGSRVRSWATRR